MTIIIIKFFLVIIYFKTNNFLPIDIKKFNLSSFLIKNKPLTPSDSKNYIILTWKKLQVLSYTEGAIDMTESIENNEDFLILVLKK